jgi:RimJ/RimL family protein N-acetyltransferase
LNVLETDRLRLRWLSPRDAAFVLQLLNEPSWLRFIGDKGVRTVQDARAYILNGPAAMYARLGFGLYLVELKTGDVSIGICGLIKREWLDDVDIGYAFLPRYWANGYAHESALAVLAYGKRTLDLKRIVAITSPGNHASAKLLERLGLRFERKIGLPGETQEVDLYAIGFGKPGSRRKPMPRRSANG